MGFFTFAAAGSALIPMGTFEALSSSPIQQTQHDTPQIVVPLLPPLLPLHPQLQRPGPLFLLYSLTGLLVNSISFPSSLLNLIALFAFVEEFLYFYVQRKDTVGIENRYFDLLLVPIFICLLELHDESRSCLPKLGWFCKECGSCKWGFRFTRIGLRVDVP